MKDKIRVIVPTIYTSDCPTIRSRLYPLCSRIASNGFEFTFLILGKETNEVYPGLTYKSYKNYWELIKTVFALNKRNVDIILSCKPHSITGLLSFIISRVRGIAYVLDVDDRITFSSSVNKWLRWILFFQEKISEQILRILKPPTVVASLGLEDFWGKHAHYISNSADTLFFSKKEKKTGRIKEGLPLDSHVIIWPAVFFHEIDREYILEIFECIQRRESNIFLIVLGKGDYLPVIKEKAKKTGLYNIIFKGEVDYERIPDFYSLSDAGIIPLRNNEFDASKGPIKLYEFMSMELPIITTPIGEPKYMVEKANCGIIIPFNDADKAADSIIELLRSKERLKQMGENGRNYLTQFQSLEQQAAKMENVLLSVIKDNWSKGKCL